MTPARLAATSRQGPRTRIPPTCRTSYSRLAHRRSSAARLLRSRRSVARSCHLMPVLRGCDRGGRRAVEVELHGAGHSVCLYRVRAPCKDVHESIRRGGSGSCRGAVEVRGVPGERGIVQLARIRLWHRRPIATVLNGTAACAASTVATSARRWIGVKSRNASHGGVGTDAGPLSGSRSL